MDIVCYIGPGVGPPSTGLPGLVLLSLGALLIGLLVLVMIPRAVYRTLLTVRYQPLAAFGIGCLVHLLMLAGLYAWALEGTGALYILMGVSAASLLAGLTAVGAGRVAGAACRVVVHDEVDGRRLARVLVLLLGIPLLLSLGIADFGSILAATPAPFLVFGVLTFVAFVAHGLDELLRMDEEIRVCPVRVPAE